MTTDLALQWRQLEESRLMASIEEKLARKQLLAQQEEWSAKLDEEKMRLREESASIAKFKVDTLAEIDSKARLAAETISQRYTELMQYRDQVLGKLKVGEDALNLAVTQLSLDRRALEAERAQLAKERKEFEEEKEKWMKSRTEALESALKRTEWADAGPLPLDIFALAGTSEFGPLVSTGNAMKEEIAALKEAKDVLEQEVVMLMEYKDHNANGSVVPPVSFSPVNAPYSKEHGTGMNYGNGTAPRQNSFQQLGNPPTGQSNVYHGAADGGYERAGDSGSEYINGEDQSEDLGPKFYPSLSMAAFNARIGGGFDSQSQRSSSREPVSQEPPRITVSTTDLMRATPTARAVRDGLALKSTTSPPHTPMTRSVGRARSGSVDSGLRNFGLGPSAMGMSSPVPVGSGEDNNSQVKVHRRLGSGSVGRLSGRRGGGGDGSVRHGSVPNDINYLPKPDASQSTSQHQQPLQTVGDAKLDQVIVHSPTPSSRSRRWDRVASNAKAAVRSARSWSPHEPLSNKLRRSPTPASGGNTRPRLHSSGSVGSDYTAGYGIEGYPDGSVKGGSVAGDGPAYDMLLQRLSACETPIDMLNCCDLSPVPNIRVPRTCALICHGFMDKLTHSGVHTFYFWLLSTQLLYGYLSVAENSCIITRAVALAGCTVKPFSSAVTLEDLQPLSFELHTPAGAVVMVADSQEVKQAWLSDLDMCIQQANRELLV